MLQQFLNIWRPSIGHNPSNADNFFEGWYFKLVNASGDRAYAIIPGIYINTPQKTSHAFIQVLDAYNNKTHYLSYPSSEFSSNPHCFSVHIGRNHFSTEHMDLHIKQDNLELEGSVVFDRVSPWPISLISPGVMGWYGLLPFLECYHGVLSFSHHLTGSITFNGEHTLLTGGKGYTEKNWGRRFPSTWIWLQANHFLHEDASFMASLARIPLMGKTFPGLIAGLWYNGQLYRFTTYLGSYINEVYQNGDELGLTLQGNKHRLQIRATMKNPLPLWAPNDTGMEKTMSESLSSTLEISLFDINRPSNPLFSLSSDNAGMEITGDIRLLSNPREGRKKPLALN